MTIPTRHGQHYYFLHDSGSQNQMVVYKIREKMSKEANKDHPEKTADVFMDPNKWAVEASLETD